MFSCCQRMIWFSNQRGPNSHTPLNLQCLLTFLYVNTRSGIEQGSSASPGQRRASGFHNTSMSQTLHWDLIVLFIEAHICLQVYHIRTQIKTSCSFMLRPNNERSLTSLCVLSLHRRSVHKTTGAHRKRYTVLNLLT